MPLPKLQIIVFSANLFSLQAYINFICKNLNLDKKKVVVQPLPKKKKLITLLKSPHVYKKSKEQFQIKYYKVTILIFLNSYHKTLFEFFLLNKPKCISVKFVLER